MRDWLAKKAGQISISTDSDGNVKAEGARGNPVPVPADEPRFTHGYEGRLTISFDSGRKIGRLSAFFVHESDPFARQLAFVEDYEQREKGSKTSITLVSWFSDDLPTGRYRLQGIQGTYLGGKQDGEEVMLAGTPALSFVLADRAGKVVKSDPDAPRVRGVEWA